MSTIKNEDFVSLGKASQILGMALSDLSRRIKVKTLTIPYETKTFPSGNIGYLFKVEDLKKYLVLKEELIKNRKDYYSKKQLRQMYKYKDPVITKECDFLFHRGQYAEKLVRKDIWEKYVEDHPEVLLDRLHPKY